MNTLTGNLLVASPKLDDTDFAQTVILMLQHGIDGATGVILNRPATETVGSFWSEVSEHPCNSQSRLRFGGPMAGPIVAVHDMATLGEFELTDDPLYVAADRNHLEQIVHQHDRDFRLFVGRAGWESGQLESELEEGAWFVVPATRDIVFTDEDIIWPSLMRRVSDTVLHRILDIKHVPEHVMMN